MRNSLFFLNCSYPVQRAFATPCRMDRKLRLVTAAAVAGTAVVFVVVLASAVWYAPQGAEELLPQNPPPAATDPPLRLVIPAIKLDARVQEAGLLAGNRMAAPTNFSDVAWYKYGTVPGAAGSAVIAGHLDKGLGLSGVFKNLSKLEAGDEIDVLTASGTVRFVVERLETYPYDQVPAAIFTATDAARLNLVTCAGKWIKTKTLGWTVDHRLVVYAVLRP